MCNYIVCKALISIYIYYTGAGIFVAGSVFHVTRCFLLPVFGVATVFSVAGKAGFCVAAVFGVAANAGFSVAGLVFYVAALVFTVAGTVCIVATRCFMCLHGVLCCRNGIFCCCNPGGNTRGK